MLMDLDLPHIHLKRALGQHQLVVGVVRAGDARAVQAVIEDRSGQEDPSRSIRRRVVLVDVDDTPSWLAAGLRSQDESSSRDQARCSDSCFASRQHNRSPLGPALMVGSP